MVFEATLSMKTGSSPAQAAVQKTEKLEDSEMEDESEKHKADDTRSESGENDGNYRAVWLHALPESVPKPQHIVYEEFCTYDFDCGFYPIALGDCFGPDERFRAVAKLGHGGYGTVWLCEDFYPVSGGLAAWKAVKLLAATESSEECAEVQTIKKFEKAGISSAQALHHGILIPEDFLWLEGPSGRQHLAIVTPLMGSNLVHVAKMYKFETAPLKNLCYQATKTLGFLHELGICHGDFRLDNMLFQLEGVEYLPEDELFKIIGRPICVLPDNDDKTDESGSYPAYLVLNTSFPFDSKYMTGKMVLTDFGVSYDVNEPTVESFIPWAYRAPDWALGSNVCGSFGPDIWSLAITLMELRLGRAGVGARDLDTIMKAYGSIAGPPPPTLLAAWKHLMKQKTEDPDYDGRYHIGDDGFPKTPYDGCRRKIKKRDPALLRTIKRPCEAVIPVDHGESWKHLPPNIRHERPGYKIMHVTMSDEDAETLYHLLSTMLKWLPHQRPTVAEILEHPWFREFRDKSDDPEESDSDGCSRTPSTSSPSPGSPHPSEPETPSSPPHRLETRHEDMDSSSDQSSTSPHSLSPSLSFETPDASTSNSRTAASLKRPNSPSSICRLPRAPPPARLARQRDFHFLEAYPDPPGHRLLPEQVDDEERWSVDGQLSSSRRTSVAPTQSSGRNGSLKDPAMSSIVEVGSAALDTLVGMLRYGNYGVTVAGGR